jgi:hypothetical protein
VLVARRLSLLLVAPSLALLLAPALRGAEPKGPKAEEARIDATYAEAQRAFDEGDCPRAMRAFAAAYRLRPHPRALLHIGHCYRRHGDLDSAAGAYAMIVDRHEGSPLARRARDLLLVVEGERARAAKEGKPARRPGPLPLRDELALKPPAAPASESEKKAEARAMAEPLTPPDSPPELAVTPAPPPVAAVPPPAVAPAAAPPAAPRSVETSVAAPSLPAAALAVPAPSLPGERPRVWTWVAAGGAALVVGAGGYFAVSAGSTKSEFESQLATRARKDELASQYSQQKTRATALFVAGGVLAAAAGALFITHF